jgi:hypothetical protein
MPDKWMSPSISAHDRLFYDFDPALYTSLDGTLQITGVVFILMPRCLSSGMAGVWARGDNIDLPLFAYHPIDYSGEQGEVSTYDITKDPVITSAYCLIQGVLGHTASFQDETLFGVFENNFGKKSLKSLFEVQKYTRDIELAKKKMATIDEQSPINLNGFIDIKEDDEKKAPFAAAISPHMVNVIPFSRSDSIRNNVEGCRIIGAGLKVFSDEAPINTGGTVYGGWIPADNILKYIANDGDINTYKSTVGIQNDLMTNHMYKGVTGSTARYSTLQSPQQAAFNAYDVSASFENAEAAGANSDWAYGRPGASGNSNDLIKPSDYVPTIIWRYNSSDQNDVYSLRVRATIHLQCQPLGTCPFALTSIHPTFGLTELQALLNNLDHFPTACEGESFKGFLKTLGRMVKGVPDVFERVDSIMNKAKPYIGLLKQAIEL